ncbi:MAG: hypothetical protein K2Y32_13005 [Candidatus Obscuribacterales bacterium]|nr:hypothetical protein [Candidatus Obscuribacterales bacterium]
MENSKSKDPISKFFKLAFESRRAYVFLLQLILFPVFIALGLAMPALKPAFTGSVSQAITALIEPSIDSSIALYWIALAAVASSLVIRNLRTYYDGEQLSVKLAIYEAGYHFLMLYIVATRTLQLQPIGDDAFIDYRYAEHWLSGQVDYNPGEKVMGFTAHLHVAFLSLLAILRGLLPLDKLSILANCFLQCLSLSYLLRLLRLTVHNPLLALAGGIIFSLSVFEMVGSAIGKEQPLGVLLILINLLAYTRKQAGIFAYSSAALAVVRPEAALWFLLAVLFSWRRFKLKSFNQLVSFWLIPAALLLIYHLWLFAYFGSPFPHAAIVKSQIYTKRAVPYAAFVELVRHLAVGVCGLSSFEQIYSISNNILILFPLGILILVLALRLKAFPAFRLYALAMFLVFLFYALPNSWIFNWYLLWFALLPPLLTVYLASLLSTHRRRWLRVLAPILLGYVIFAQISTYPNKQFAMPCPFFLYQAEWGRFAIYRQIGRQIKELAAPGDLAAVTEPGLVGFYYGGPILDLGGLISDNVVSCYPPKARQESPDLLYAPPVSALTKFRPRFLCFQDGLVTRDFLESSELKEHYRLVAFYPLPIYRATGLYLYQRSD